MGLQVVRVKQGTRSVASRRWHTDPTQPLRPEPGIIPVDICLQADGPIAIQHAGRTWAIEPWEVVIRRQTDAQTQMDILQFIDRWGKRNQYSHWAQQTAWTWAQTLQEDEARWMARDLWRSLVAQTPLEKTVQRWHTISDILQPLNATMTLSSSS